MNEKMNLIQKLLEKFKFTGPLAPADQAFILSSMREALVSTLKVLNQYSFVYGMVLKIFFMARRMGIRITAAQSALMLGIITVFAAAAIAGGITVARGLLTSGNEPLPLERVLKKIEEPNSRDMSLKIAEKEKVGEKKIENSPVIAYRLGIEGFSNDNIDRNKSLLVTERIRAGLAGYLGSGSIINLSDGNRTRNFNLLLTGSVGKLGSLIMISAKVVDLEKGSALYITDENINSDSEIISACDRISGRIAEKIMKK